MKNKRIHQSSGVTIIEVLFSTGIIVTGLLGVAGLIMVAGTQMTQGLEADAMSNAGLNAIAEFETRNMQRPDNLAWYDPDANNFVPVPLDFILGKSFCIDPYLITQRSFDEDYNNISYFPKTTPYMYRLTLRDLVSQERMSLPLTREIFVAKDDLAFSTSTSGTELPKQQWIREGLDGPELKRANRAAYSWLATLTPAHAPALETTDHYLLSVVVFKNRVITNSNDVERSFNITFLNGGLGGGEVKLFPTDPDGLYPRHGNWVMLSTKASSVHRWYRITYIEEETYPEGGRHATLQGPDWSHPAASTRVTLIPEVIGVFEKTTRLGLTSLY